MLRVVVCTEAYSPCTRVFHFIFNSRLCYQVLAQLQHMQLPPAQRERALKANMERLAKERTGCLMDALNDQLNGFLKTFFPPNQPATSAESAVLATDFRFTSIEQVGLYCNNRRHGAQLVGHVTCSAGHQ
jgi:hypothetical protein